MAKPDSKIAPNRLFNAFLIVAILCIGKDLFIPLALAGLFSFLLIPVVNGIQKLGVSRIPSVLSATALSFLPLVFIGWIAASQIAELASKAPEYEGNLRAKIQTVREKASGPLKTTQGVLEKIKNHLSIDMPQMQEDLATSTPEHPAQPVHPGANPDNPVWTQTVAAPTNATQILRNSIEPVLGPIGTFGLVVILTIFILISREDIRDRFIRLLGEKRLGVTTEALDESGSKVARYLLMQLLVNISYGLPVYVALFLIGIPNALLWGTLATVLRFVPYIGPWIAAFFPTALSFAISADWSLPLLTVGVFIALELISNNFVEPWLYGKNTGLSPFAVLVSAMFWTWIWGTIGLVLSTPLTVCLVVLGKHLPALEPIAVLFGDEPALTPEVRIYQRLLAGDVDEASEVLSQLAKTQSLQSIFDNHLVLVLMFAQADRQSGTIDKDKAELVFDGLNDILQSEFLDIAKDGSDRQGAEIYCIPARDRADELAGLMLKILMAQEGIDVHLFPCSRLVNEMISESASVANATFVVSSMPASAVTNSRYIFKKFRQVVENAEMIVAVWKLNISGSGGKEEYARRIWESSPPRIETNFSEAVNNLRAIARMG